MSFHGAQACFVPYTNQGRRSGHRTLVIILNTPDTYTGSETTQYDVRKAFASASAGLEGFVGVIRSSYNVFFVFFSKGRFGMMALNAPITVPSSVHASNKLTVRLEFLPSHGPRVFVCDNLLQITDFEAVYEGICNALRGRPGAPVFSLLQLWSPRGTRSSVLVLRFASNFLDPCMQRLCFPIASKVDGEIHWAVFYPYVQHRPCAFCQRDCQRGAQCTCRYATVVGSS